MKAWISISEKGEPPTPVDPVRVRREQVKTMLALSPKILKFNMGSKIDHLPNKPDYMHLPANHSLYKMHIVSDLMLCSYLKNLGRLATELEAKGFQELPTYRSPIVVSMERDDIKLFIDVDDHVVYIAFIGQSENQQ